MARIEDAEGISGGGGGLRIGTGGIDGTRFTSFRGLVGIGATGVDVDLTGESGLPYAMDVGNHSKSAASLIVAEGRPDGGSDGVVDVGVGTFALDGVGSSLFVKVSVATGVAFGGSAGFLREACSLRHLASR